MKVSIITPTHKPDHLEAAYASLREQSFDNWEWVLLPNRGGTLPEFTDGRIVTRPVAGEPSIGALKKQGFMQASGDVLVELDHDDLLVPDALALIVEHIRGADFAYSNTVEFNEDWTPYTYNAVFGWAYRPFVYQGHALLEGRAFAPTPAAFGYIWWAPNHVRAWTREGYARAGGHRDMTIGDDHDLLVRTYLTGKVEHIDQPLYLQRMYSGNTSRGEVNPVIQKTTRAIYRDNIQAIVRRWCELESLPLYDLGGAFNCPEGWEPVDLATGVDLRERWPWEDSSVGAFRAFDLLEHLPDKMHSLSEMHRCLVPGGWALTFTPSALGVGAFQDPTHCSYWVKNSFKYVTERSHAAFIRNETVRFQAMRLVEEFPNARCKEENMPYITADLVALKPGYRGPGKVLI